MQKVILLLLWRRSGTGPREFLPSLCCHTPAILFFFSGATPTLSGSTFDIAPERLGVVCLKSLREGCVDVSALRIIRVYLLPPPTHPPINKLV